ALEHHVEITLANTRSVPASVDVRERVPVAREDDDDVQVRAVSADPPWKPFEQPDQPVEGAFHWQLELGPGAEQTLHASYTVEIPSKRELVGGNRRER
ncbi:MAG: DUF4139 domain-containing protein, partial [Oligoflexia bacterium]|nr:DUF4139 domain-containing protein [Oligoflexia bacterium]